MQKIGNPLARDPAEEGLRGALIRSRREPIADRLRDLVAGGYLHLPRPGSGESWSRLRRLAEIAAEDLSLARLAEGHADSHAILNEAGIGPEYPPDGGGPVYGVWVAGRPLEVRSQGKSLVLEGEREYCSGAGIVERALVTGRWDGDGPMSLFEIDATEPGLREVPCSWPAVGMAATHSVTLELDDVSPLREVGEPGFYEQRVGFWLGSLNVAACWYGGALGLARGVSGKGTSQADHALAARLDGALVEMRLTLLAAACEIDASPCNEIRQKELLALRVRDCVYRNCQVVIETAAELGGTSSSTHNAVQARRLADLPVYLRQYHPARDRARIGELLHLSRQEQGGYE